MKDEEKKSPSPEATASQKEEKILKFWQENKIFEKTLTQPSPNGNFVFFDGPPFATGLPHYGHILPGTIKDIIPRYQTMLGKRILRRWGWDTHGLPLENLVEKELGLKTKKDIETLGIDKFNAYARSLVFRYADEWKKIIPRTGRWVDMENDYRTIDASYTESVWWAFKTLYNKGLVTKGFKSMHLCPRCETTLSNFEVNQGYKDITDISVYVKFELTDEPGTYVLAWTTTPWTLPGNVALAISKDIKYVKVLKDGTNLILAKDLVEKVLKDGYEILEEVPAEELLGRSYKPLFPYYDNEKLENRQNGFKVVSADFVTTEDGTGVVHIAPAFGEDDMNLGKEKNLPFIQHVKTDGTFKDEVMDFAGLHVKPIEDTQKTDVEIIKYLAKQGTLFAKEKIVHSYPHCWRCGTPLLNYATSSWFIKVTAFRDRLVELNKTISWTPEDIGEGRFGKWLEGARDWAISRSRYWGAPLPVWENADGERTILGSIADLKDRIGRKNNFFLMRHGESEANANGNKINCAEREGNPLTRHGLEETKKSAESFVKDGNKIDVVIRSPFFRARQTAEIVADIAGFDKSKIIVDERLREIFVDGYDGKSWEEFLVNFSSMKDRFERSVDGSETWSDVTKRVMEFMYDIDSKYENKNILIIGHGAPLNLISLASNGLCLEEIIKKYQNNAVPNSEIIKCDFVSLPHNERFEIDLHRPFIDDVALKNEKGETLKRIPEVFDCWLESGSMPFAQNHYPFENKEIFDAENSPLFPADFIAEGLDQTRGWFYTMLVLSVGLFDRVPYKHVLVNGLVLAEDGRKMSKSLNNYPDPMNIVDKYGADALRYYLIASPLVKAGDLNFVEKGVDEVYKKIIQKIYNVLSFYEMYPVAQKAELKKTILDDWMLSRLTELANTVTVSLEKYELDRASRPIMDFVDDLSTWYLRRSRDRFKSDDPSVQYSVSYYTALVLREFSKIIAPFMPFIAEEVYSRVGGEKESVHLESWPLMSKMTLDTKLIEKMVRVRGIVTSALEMRQKAGMKVRQPLQTLKIKSEKFEDGLVDIIKDEINVKEIIFDSSIETDIALDTELTPELREEGVARDIIRGIQDARKNENLNPGDSVTLVVFAGKEIVSIFEKYSDMIKTPTGVKNTEYASEKQKHEVKLEKGEMTISIIRNNLD